VKEYSRFYSSLPVNLYFYRKNLSPVFYGREDLAISKWLLLAGAGMITLLLLIITKLFCDKNRVTR
jgi:hypothetical protein